MSIRLVVTVPLQEDEEKTYDYVFEKTEITLGRHSRNDIQIPAPQVSTEHSRILVEGDKWYIVDLGSQAGTTLDGEALETDKRVEFTADSVIGVAGCTIRVSPSTEEVTQEKQEATQQVAMQMVREVLGALSGDSGGPYLEVVNDDEEGDTAALEGVGDEFEIGRESDCRLRLSHWSVSRRHALVKRTADGVTIEDLESKNKVMINDSLLETSHEPHRLQDGDLVFVGHTQIRFRDPNDTLIDQLDDIPTPINLDIKTTIIDLPSSASAEATAGKPSTSEPAAADQEPAAVDKPAEKPKKKAAAKAESAPMTMPDSASAETTADRPSSHPFEDEGGGLGDWVYFVIGGVVILGVIIAALVMFVL